MKKIKNILIVSYYFYPFSEIGAKRISYLAEFLFEKGIGITVVKAANSAYGKLIDNKLIHNKNIKIVEVENVDFYKSIGQKIACSFKFYKVLKHSLKNEKYDMIYFCGGPYFYFPLGILFSKLFKIPYILDFRDPWIIAHRRKEFLNWKGRFFREMETFLEKVSIKKSYITIYVTTKIRDNVKHYFPVLSSGKFLVLENGYNEKEMPEKIKNKAAISNSLKIGVFGKFALYNFQNSNILVEGIKKISDEIDVKVYHLGQKEKILTDAFEKNNIIDFIEEIGYKNYTEAINILSELDIMILNHRTEFLIGTKIFEYLYLNKPILAFIPENSAIWDLLSKFRNTFRIENSDDFVNAINQIKSAKDKTVIDEKEIVKYSRKYQCEKFFDHLQKLWE